MIRLFCIVNIIVASYIPVSALDGLTVTDQVTPVASWHWIDFGISDDVSPRL